MLLQMCRKSRSFLVDSHTLCACPPKKNALNCLYPLTCQSYYLPPDAKGSAARKYARKYSYTPLMMVSRSPIACTPSLSKPSWSMPSRTCRRTFSASKRSAYTCTRRTLRHTKLISWIEKPARLLDQLVRS